MNLFRKEPEAAVANTAPELNEDPLATVPKNKWAEDLAGSGLRLRTLR